MNPIWGNDDPDGLVINGLMAAACVVLAFRGYWRLFVPCFLLGIFVWAFFMTVGLPTLMIPFCAIWMPFSLVLAVRNVLKQRRSNRKERQSDIESIRHIEERLVQMDITIRHLHEYPQYLRGPVSGQLGLSISPKPEKQKLPLFWDE